MATCEIVIEIPRPHATIGSRRGPLRYLPVYSLPRSLGTVASGGFTGTCAARIIRNPRGNTAAHPTMTGTSLGWVAFQFGFPGDFISPTATPHDSIRVPRFYFTGTYINWYGINPLDYR